MRSDEDMPPEPGRGLWHYAVLLAFIVVGTCLVLAAGIAVQRRVLRPPPFREECVRFHRMVTPETLDETRKRLHEMGFRAFRPEE